MGVVGKIADSFGNLGLVELPVTQAGIVVVARKLALSEPAVVKHEHLKAHGRSVVHHVGKGLGVEREICSLPAVQQGRAVHRSVVHPVSACPVVQVTAGLSGAASAVSPYHIGSYEGRTAGE